MEYVIATSLVKKKIKKNNVYLGNWALDNKSYFSSKKSKIKPFIWENKKKFEKDSLYIKKTCKKFYKIISLSLNQTHKSKFSKRFWKILLFPWLYYYISSLYFRWETIKKIKNKSSIFIFKKNFNKYINSRLSDVYLIVDDNWNQKIFQDIVLFQKKKFIFQKDKAEITNNFKIKFNLKKIFFIFLPNIFFKFLNYLISKKKTKKFLFIQTSYPKSFFSFFFKRSILINYFYYFLNRVNIFFVNTGNLNFYLREKFSINFYKKKITKNSFEKFIIKKVTEDLPSYLLEEFHNYLHRYLKFANSRFIITSYAIFNKLPNKFYIAEQINRGSKLYLLEHGGSLAAKKDYLDLDLDLVDKKITWHKPFNNKETRIPTHPFHYHKELCSKSIDYSNNSKCIIAGGGDYKHIYHNSYYIKAPQIIYQLNSIKKFYKFLDIKIQQNTFIKPHEVWTKDFSFDYINFYKKIFKKNIIRHTRLEKCINSAKIVVCVYPQTTFSNAMYSEVPTILFFNKDHYIFHDKFSKLIQQLVKNKIIFYDPRLAAIHLNEIWKNPYDWYNSYEVKKVRNLFLKDALSIVYPRNIKEEEKNWKNIFS